MLDSRATRFMVMSLIAGGFSTLFVLTGHPGPAKVVAFIFAFYMLGEGVAAGTNIK